MNDLVRNGACQDSEVTDQGIDSIPDWDRIFRQGVEFRAWPAAKWEHAWALSDSLWRQYIEYRESLGTETTAELSADRRIVTFHAHIEIAPPLDRWTLLLGDILHNYRSALDGLAWELAHLDGQRVAPKHERQLYFPLAQTEDRWLELMTTTLSSMPQVILDRLHTVQPYRFEPVDQGIGVLLNQMSNLDKHRSAISLELRVADKTTFEVRMKPDNKNAPRTYDYEFVAPDRALRNGDKVLVFKESGPVSDPAVPTLPLVLSVAIEEQVYDVFHLLRLIERQVASTFVNACVGIAPEEWATFMMGDGPRPTTPWCPNTRRFSAEMRKRALGLT